MDSLSLIVTRVLKRCYQICNSIVFSIHTGIVVMAYVSNAWNLSYFISSILFFFSPDPRIFNNFCINAMNVLFVLFTQHFHSYLLIIAFIVCTVHRYAMFVVVLSIFFFVFAVCHFISCEISSTRMKDLSRKYLSYCVYVSVVVLVHFLPMTNKNLFLFFTIRALRLKQKKQTESKLRNKCFRFKKKKQHMINGDTQFSG